MDKKPGIYKNFCLRWPPVVWTGQVVASNKGTWSYTNGSYHRNIVRFHDHSYVYMSYRRPKFDSLDSLSLKIWIR